MIRGILIANFVLVAAAVALFLVTYPNWYRFWTIESCIDQGGAWNYEQEICEYCEEPSCMSPVARCDYYGGEWQTGEGCVGSTDSYERVTQPD